MSMRHLIGKKRGQQVLSACFFQLWRITYLLFAYKIAHGQLCVSQLGKTTLGTDRGMFVLLPSTPTWLCMLVCAFRPKWN
jgi:hypothetical protein